MISDRRIGRLCAFLAIVLQPIAISLPDGLPGSPRAIVNAVSIGLMAGAVFMGFRERK